MSSNDKSALVTRTWAGGASADPKIGGANSFKRSQSIDHRKHMSSIRLHKKTVKESGTVVDTAIFDATRTPDNNVYFAGGTKVYRRIPEVAGGNGTWSSFKTNLTNVKSSVYSLDRKKVYLPGDKTMHAINYFNSGSPTFQQDLFGQLLDFTVTNAGTNAYTLLTSISEAAANRYSWQPEIEPLIKVGFYVIAKGTGDVTATIHDAANNSLGTAVITNASLTNGAVNYITFTSQIRMQAKPNPQTYHVHLTVSTGTTTIRVLTASDMSTMDFQSYADALISGVYHPAGQFEQYVIVGNDNYVAVWEPITDAPLKSEFDPHRLKLPTEYRVLGFTEWNEYYIISAYKSVSSDYTADFGVGGTEGLLAFWDGASKGFAWFKKIEGGAMESIYTMGGLVYGYINGVLHVTSGDTPVPLFPMPGVDDFTSTHSHDDDVYLQAPYKAMCVRNNILQMGFPMLTSNDSVDIGVFSFGKKTKDYIESFTYDHVPSHGSTREQYTGANVPLSGISYVGNFGKNMFIAWTHGNSGTQTFGVDVVRENNPCYTEGSIDYLDMDNRVPYKTKEGIEIIVTYDSLPAGADIQPRYRLNGESTYQYGSASNLTRDTIKKQHILKIPELSNSGGSYQQMEYGLRIVGGSDGTSPVITSTTIVVDSRASEGL